MTPVEMGGLVVSCVGAALVGVNFLLLGELKASERARSALVAANANLHVNFASNDERLQSEVTRRRVAENKTQVWLDIGKAAAQCERTIKALGWTKTPPGWSTWAAYTQWRINDLLAASVAYRERAVASEARQEAALDQAHAEGYADREAEEHELMLIRGQSTDIITPTVEAIWRPKVNSAAMQNALVVSSAAR